MDKELDILLCHLDSQITLFRQKNNRTSKALISLQTEIHRQWFANRNSNRIEVKDRKKSGLSISLENLVNDEREW